MIYNHSVFIKFLFGQSLANAFAAARVGLSAHIFCISDSSYVRTEKQKDNRFYPYCNSGCRFRNYYISTQTPKLSNSQTLGRSNSLTQLLSHRFIENSATGYRDVQ